MGDVEHAHSARIDVDVFDCRGWSGYGVRLDVLGDRADDVQAASDVQATSQGRRHRIAGSTSRAVTSRAMPRCRDRSFWHPRQIRRRDERSQSAASLSR